MGVCRNFSRRGQIDILLIYIFRVVGDATQMDVGLYKKDNVECYGNSSMQCFPCKKTLH